MVGPVRLHAMRSLASGLARRRARLGLRHQHAKLAPGDLTDAGRSGRFNTPYTRQFNYTPARHDAASVIGNPARGHWRRPHVEGKLPFNRTSYKINGRNATDTGLESFVCFSREYFCPCAGIDRCSQIRSHPHELGLRWFNSPPVARDAEQSRLPNNVACAAQEDNLDGVRPNSNMGNLGPKVGI